MSDCPRCFHELDENRSDGGVSWQCPDCGGLLATLPFLRRRLSVEAANRIWQTARETEPGSSSRECPFCGKGMVRVRSEFDGREIELDACLPCQAFWFDRGEVEALPAAPPPPPPDSLSELSDATREKLLATELQVIQARADADPHLGSPLEGETNGLPKKAILPWATLLMTALSVAAWITAPRTTCNPDPYSVRNFWLLLFLLAWRLLTFGCPAEGTLGGVRLLALWSASGLTGCIGHLAMGEDPMTLGVPVSAEAFLGVLVWLAFRFPEARVSSYWRSCRTNTIRMGFARVLLPISLLAVLWGLMCAFLPRLVNLNIGKSGSLFATLAAAAVGVAFHLAGRHMSSRRARRSSGRRETWKSVP